jgi:Tfp pilus assembly protein PilF
MTSSTSPVSAAQPAAGPRAVPGDPSRLDQRDWVTILGLVVLTSIVFFNGLRGEFVLDDQKQIVRNDLIRLPKFWGKALTSDIWAFQGERDTPWSNYWRPGHVAWLILNYRAFGPDPIGWHLSNVLAHLGVVACAFVLLRWLGATWGVATSIGALFAIHPTRCESVTWIAGVHDVLATLWQIGALLLLMSIWRRAAGIGGEPLAPRARAFRWTAAVAMYVLAVTTKEIAILFPVVVALVRYTELPTGDLARLKRAVVPALPFAVVAAMFLVARQVVLGRAQLAMPGQPGFLVTLATLPLVLCYYLRQIMLPYWIGWSYPARALDAQHTGLWTFFVPLAIVIAAVAAARPLARGRLGVVGAAVFVLTLLPALNVRALHPEQIVKDRYLYMPLLGFLMVVVPPAAATMRRALGARTAAVVGGLAVAVLVVLLSIRTMRYNTAWLNELALWEWAVWADDRSASNWEALARTYMHAQPPQYARARAAFDRALALRPDLTDAYINRAELALREGNFEQAAEDAQRVLGRFPDHWRAYERLAIARQQQGRLDEAAEVCRTARERVPSRTAYFTDQLAIVLIQQGRRPDALAELESVRQRAETDYAPGSRMVLFHLGMLYREMGRADDATATLRRFLELTEGTAEPNLVTSRERARQALGRGSR